MRSQLSACLSDFASKDMEHLTHLCSSCSLFCDTLLYEALRARTVLARADSNSNQQQLEEKRNAPPVTPGFPVLELRAVHALTTSPSTTSNRTRLIPARKIGESSTHSKGKQPTPTPSRFCMKKQCGVQNLDISRVGLYGAAPGWMVEPGGNRQTCRIPSPETPRAGLDRRRTAGRLGSAGPATWGTDAFVSAGHNLSSKKLP